MKKFIAPIFAGLMAFATFTSATPASADTMAPDVLIRTTAEEVLTIVKQDRDLRNGDPKKVNALVNAKVLPHFDFERMTRLAVGRAWRNATPEQKKSLVTEFRTLIVRTYTNAFKHYQDETVEVKPVTIPAGADEITVKTQIKKPGVEPDTVDYEMEKTDEGWKAFDVTVDGVSLVTTYRGTFTDEVQKSGIDGLIKLLADKNAANAALKKADAK